VVKIEKLEVAKRNLAAAIRLFFERGDAVAVHTLASAAQGVIRDIARARELEHTSVLHDNPMVSADERKDWVNAINAPRNFFKHADKDADGLLEFNEKSNEQVLLDAALVLTQLEDEPLREASVFLAWCTTAHPELRAGLSGNVIGDYCVRNHVDPEDFPRFRRLCDEKVLIEPLEPEGPG
jgi:hypothetical protein